jgi:hypothetical protein
MGHVGAFRAVLSAHLLEFLVPMDDQAWWQERYLLQTCAEKDDKSAEKADEPRVRVLLDAHARVFQCLWGAQSHLERGEHGLWRNTITGCVVRLQRTTMHRCAAKRVLLALRACHERAASVANALRCRHRPHRASSTHVCSSFRRSLTPCCLRRAQDVPCHISRQRRAERIPVRDVPRAAREARAH